MGRKDARGRSTTGGKFVQLPEYMMASQAWASLTPSQRVVYIELRRLYNGKNNGFLALSVRAAAERCNIHRNSVGPSLKVLEERGFIECVTPGGFGTNARKAAEFRLTDQICNQANASPTRAFARWRPDLEARHNPSDRPSQNSAQRNGKPAESVAPFVTAGAG